MNVGLTIIQHLTIKKKLRDALNHISDGIDDNLQKTNKQLREVHDHAIEFNQNRNIFLEQTRSKDKGTTEKIERTLRLRIERQREIGRTIARAKRKVFQLVTKLFYSDKWGMYECITQKDFVTACILDNKKRFVKLSPLLQCNKISLQKLDTLQKEREGNMQ